MCALAVFAAMPRAEEQPKPVVLEGRTARGDRIELVVYDGRLHSFRTNSAVHCPKPWSYWQRWRWQPIDGLPGMRFRQEDGRFHVRHPVEYPRDKPPSFYLNELRGELSDDGRSASGTLHARATYGSPDAPQTVCEATVRFRAR